MAVDASGNVIVTGRTTTASGGNDWKTVKFNGTTGAQIWEQVFDSGLGGDQAFAVTVDTSGNAIVTGYAWNGTNGDIRTIKYAAANGAVLWQKTLTGASGGTGFGIAIATDTAGNVFVGGSTWNGTNDDMVTVKYAAADGTVLWQQAFAGAANGNEYVFAIALDSAGNAVVTGESQNAAGNYDWKTIKYAAANGAVLWQATFAGAGNGDDVAYGVAIDGSDNAIVTGYSYNGTNLDMKTIKYAAANGAVLWQASLAGAGSGDDIAYSVKLDGAGNAFVTGFSFNGTTNDWMTIKYASANGAVLWQKSFISPGNGSDIAPALAVDASGNVIAAGRNFNGANQDIQAIKYASLDGAVLWQYAYAGTGAGFDRVAAVAALSNSVVLAGESTETGKPLGWRVISVAAVAPDTVPDAFSFASQTGVPVSTVITSATITPTGYDTATAISVAGGTYSVGCTATFTSTASTISPGSSVCVRHTSSAALGTSVNTTLTIGGVSATFTSTTTSIVTLTTTRTGSGSGTVTSAPSGINCGATCSTGFSSGTSVTLNAAPAGGSLFTGWSGGGCASTGSCQLTLNTATTVTATFALLAATPTASASPTTLAFGGQSMQTTAPSQVVTLMNAGSGTLTITSISSSNTQFTQTNNCTSLASAASCTINVSFTPTVQGSITGTLTIATNGGSPTVALTGTGEFSLVTHFYRSILQRAPDATGKAFWENEALRVQSLGANVNETWYAMAQSFYFSPEYLAFNRTNAQYVGDLYKTFYNRTADATGLSYWTGQLTSGLPREVVLVSFMLSKEFTTFTQSIFGNPVVRAEINTVMDFYRGLIARLPDAAGFNFWTAQFRTAQCAGSAAVYQRVESISSQFATGSEYAARNRTNAQYVGDLYNSFLRRGGDLAGVQYWINQITSGARTRENVRQQFLSSPEFTNRVNAIVAETCLI